MFRFRKRACTHLERILSGGKPILCLCVAGILLASIFLPETYVFPRNAYAEESTNSTSEQNTVISLNDTSTNSTDVVVANQNSTAVTNDTSTNSTDVVVANQNSTAVTNDTSTNSTDVVVANQNSTAVTNDTSTNSTDVVVANQNSTAVTNDTSTNSTDVPEVLQSWQFSSTANASATKIAPHKNTVSSEPIPGGYLQENVNDTNKLTALSISVWVKPDYSQGSPEFTVISKYNSFILSINNIIPATQIAKFSVFNGIKWYTVESTTQIPQQWTHLASTFNGTAICLYVNEKMESCSPLPETLISVRGDLTITKLNNLTSDSDIVIGAYVNPVRENVSNQFNDLVDAVKLYDTPLQPPQVSEIFNENKQKYQDYKEPDSFATDTLSATLP